jgi:Rrf2 family transcriptional regulator, nitric oxide-sensitive transcriptional repressor
VRLTTFTDYSLRLLIYLAAAREQRATIAEVAQAFGVSEHHLVKVAHRLGKDGFLRNSRGRGGGIQLARPPAAINLGEVVRLTEGGDMPAECFDPQTSRCPIDGVCRLNGVLRAAVDAFYRALENHTLADLAINRPKLVSLLRLEPDHSLHA